MKNIVVFNEFPIFPPMFGGQVRIYNIYKNLSQKHNVTYICFGNSENIQETRICDNFLEIRVPKNQIHKRINAVAGKLLGVSVDDIVAMFLCRHNREIDSIAKKYVGKCDIVVLSHPYMFPLVRDYIANKPLVYESHNVEFLLKKSLLGNGILKNYICSKVLMVEKSLSIRSDIVFVTSREDMSSIKKLYSLDGDKIHVSSNGVNTESFDFIYDKGHLIKEKIIDCPLIIFLGSGHPPNVQAAKIIINEIAPKMKDACFLICGSVCWGVKNESRGKNIGLTFEVSEEEKLELYRVSDIAINPMTSGSGTNIKMLDYMSASLPVVSTPVGARGLNLVNYENVIVCDIPEMPEKIREILLNKELYETIGTAGRRVVESEYDWRKIAQKMCGTLEKVADKKSASVL